MTTRNCPCHLTCVFRPSPLIAQTIVGLVFIHFGTWVVAVEHLTVITTPVFFHHD